MHGNSSTFHNPSQASSILAMDIGLGIHQHFIIQANHLYSTSKISMASAIFCWDAEVDCKLESAMSLCRRAQPTPANILKTMWKTHGVSLGKWATDGVFSTSFFLNIYRREKWCQEVASDHTLPRSWCFGHWTGLLDMEVPLEFWDSLRISSCESARKIAKMVIKDGDGFFTN